MKGDKSMLINSKKNKDNYVKFVSYSGKYPNLCSGILVLEIDGEQVTFGDYNWKTKTGNYRFWSSGGSCGFYDNYSESYVDNDEWVIDKNNIPEQYRQYAEEIDRVFNENVEYGCCGGCL